MDKAEAFYKLFPSKMREQLMTADYRYEELREIRIRVGQPILIRRESGEVPLLYRNSRTPYVIDQGELQELINYICDFSIYAYEEELKQGFITTIGGHRIGIGGSVATEESRIRTFRYITCLNIRIAHELKGVGVKLLPYLICNQEVCNTLVISPPGCGKTTLLRDLIRLLSDGGYTIGLADERSEIGGGYMGVPQNDIGSRTDVIEGCYKSHAIMMLLRSMAPQIIAVDEIGNQADVDAVQNALHSGCRMIATIHGYGISDVTQKRMLKELMLDGSIERFVLLSGNVRGARCVQVYDQHQQCIGTYTEEIK